MMYVLRLGVQYSGYCVLYLTVERFVSYGRTFSRINVDLKNPGKIHNTHHNTTQRGNNFNKT